LYVMQFFKLFMPRKLPSLVSEKYNWSENSALDYARQVVSYYLAFAPKSEAVKYMDYRATLRLQK